MKKQLKRMGQIKVGWLLREKEAKKMEAFMEEKIGEENKKPSKPSQILFVKSLRCSVFCMDKSSY